MQYKITATGVTFPASHLPEHFPNVSLPAVLAQSDLDFLGLEVLPDPEPIPPTAEEIAARLAAELAAAKTAKNNQINAWRAAANQTSFTHSGRQIACDALSRSDIDAVAGSIALNGAFPAGFPGAWKATDNSYVMLPDVDAFKSLYASMTLQGAMNFSHAQTLKGQLAGATTIEQVNALTWS